MPPGLIPALVSCLFATAAVAAPDSGNANPPGSSKSKSTTMQEFNEAHLLIKNKHLLEGRQRLQMLTSRPDATADIYCALAETFLDFEGTDEDTPGGIAAMNGLQTALKKDPNSSRAYKDLALLSNLHGKFAEGAQYATKALSVPKPAMESHRQRALAYSHLNRMNDAVKDIDAYINSGAQSSTNYMLRGDFQQAMKHYSEAAQSYQKALAASSGKYSDRSFNQLLKCLSLDGKNAQAIAEISKQLGKSADNSELLDLRGQYEVKEKKTQEALRDFSAAIAIDPLSAFLDHRAALYDSLGQKKLADADRAKSKKVFGGEF